MSEEYLDGTYTQIRDTITRLQSPILDLETLQGLLSAPLDAMCILPPRFLKSVRQHIPPAGILVQKHIPLLQRALLEYILPSWAETLDENNSYELVLQYFSPDSFSFSLPVSKDLAILAYSTVVSLPFTEHSARIGLQLTRLYPVDVLWRGLASSKKHRGKEAVTWEDLVRNAITIPAKAANAFGPKGNLPRELVYGAYFTEMSKRCEIIVSSLSDRPTQDELSSIGYLLTKLVNVGVFPSTIPSSPNQPSFFQAVLPSIRTQFNDGTSSWPLVLSAIGSIHTLQSILISLCSHLRSIDDLSPSSEIRAAVKHEARTLRALLGRLTGDSDMLDGLSATLFGRRWSVGHARMFVCWAAGAQKSHVNREGVETLMSKVLDSWTMPDHIKHSTMAEHRYLTAFFLLLLHLLPASSQDPTSLSADSLALSTSFIRSISAYISHLDASVRRCGMLVAEEVAHMAGKKLDFGDWDGDEDGKDWCRQLRRVVSEPDAEADDDAHMIWNPPASDYVDSGSEIKEHSSSPEPSETQTNAAKQLLEAQQPGYDSDDSLMGYGSDGESTRSPSPTPSELEEAEKDPTINVGRKKIQRPVYLAQLGEMVRPTSGVQKDDQDEPRRIDIALDVAEELIRRKRAYGTELEENAVNLVFAFLALQDNFALDRFDERRQAALDTLVACCPKKAAPCLIEEFFKQQYSTEQRFALLNALASGAREMAGVTLPSRPKVDPSRIAFPSKQLPPSLHHKYLSIKDVSQRANPVRDLLEDFSTKAIERAKDSTENRAPQLVREKKLRVTPQRPHISEMSSRTELLSQQMQSLQLQHKPIVPFVEVAAEYMICPMMNRFWLFLRDEQARETRTTGLSELHQYKAAGTGLILSPLVLSQFVRTLAVLVHMARHAKEWLAVIAPDALELAVTVGTRPLSQDIRDENDGDNVAEEQKSKDAALLTSSLELAVIVVDGCLELDDGKSLGLEHTALLLGTSEWAFEILRRLEGGEKMLGGGGVHEIRLRRAAAGLALKIDELSERWRRSMVQF